jgi:hypothetical protein
MKIIVNKAGKNSVTVQRPGFAPKAMTYLDFFEQEMYEPNKYSFVDSVELIDKTIKFYKLEAEYELQYTDDYILDEELFKNVDFTKQLYSFLETYDLKKEELNKTLDERLKKGYFGFKYSSQVKGQDLYKEYVKTGKVPYIYRDEVAIRILDSCQNNPKKITDHEYDDSYYGHSVGYTVEHKENKKYITATKVCAGISLLSFVGTIITLPISVATASIPLAITGMTGYGAHHFNKTWYSNQDKKDAENIAIILEELKNRYNYLEPINKNKTK